MKSITLADTQCMVAVSLYATIQRMKNMLKLKARTPRKITTKSLRKWNIGLAGLHLVQAIIVVVLSKSNGWPVTTSYLTTDSVASKVAGHPVLASATRTLFSINLAYLVAGFFIMSAIAHTVIATVYRKRYEADLTKGINRVRWIEYGFSASTMMVAIGLLSGIYDFSSMIMIFGLVLIMNLMGLAMELQNATKKKPKWFVYWVGCLAGIIPWIVLAVYTWGATIYGTEGVPTFVYWIYISIFLFFNSFAANMYFQYRGKGKWSDYLYGERVYMILSLVAKTALAWQVFAGALRP